MDAADVFFRLGMGFWLGACLAGVLTLLIALTGQLLVNLVLAALGFVLLAMLALSATLCAEAVQPTGLSSGQVLFALATCLLTAIPVFYLAWGMLFLTPELGNPWFWIYGILAIANLAGLAAAPKAWR